MLTNGIMRIFTDQLNAHIKKQADKKKIPILWWPSVGGVVLTAPSSDTWKNTMPINIGARETTSTASLPTMSVLLPKAHNFTNASSNSNQFDRFYLTNDSKIHSHTYCTSSSESDMFSGIISILSNEAGAKCLCGIFNNQEVVPVSNCPHCIHVTGTAIVLGVMAFSMDTWSIR